MEINELISSGLIEVYCLGMASDEEKSLVENQAAINKSVRREIELVREALVQLGRSSSATPPASLKIKILDLIEEVPIYSFPPRVSLSSRADEWLEYLEQNKITTPDSYDVLHLMDLPGNEKQVTYIVWAKKGTVVEESHSEEEEYLLMLKGHCSIIINGKIGYYKEGDIAFIPKGAVHRAEVLSDEPMLIIGQRIAA